MSESVVGNTLDNGSSGKPRSNSRGMLWTGRVLSTLAILFLLMDSVMKLFKPQVVIDGTVSLGYSERVIIPLGIVLLVSTLLYAIPWTTVLGAILLTGYLGGAVATHVHHGDSLFGHILFPTYLGVMIWLGLVLRDSRIRAVLPFTCAK
jgi:hypothetical protein